MKVGDLVKLTRDSDYQPQIFRRGMVGIVDVRVSGAGDRPVVSYLAMDLEVINERR